MTDGVEAGLPVVGIFICRELSEVRLVPRLVEYGIMIHISQAYESWWAEDMFNQFHHPFWSAVELPCMALKEKNNIWADIDM